MWPGNLTGLIWTMRKMAEMREGEKHLFENLARAICAVANGLECLASRTKFDFQPITILQS